MLVTHFPLVAKSRLSAVRPVHPLCAFITCRGQALRYFPLILYWPQLKNCFIFGRVMDFKFREFKCQIGIL
jgi:hypothetical protein